MRARDQLGLLGAVAVLALAGCIPEAQLRPTPDARSPAGEPSAVIADAQGVRLIADGTAWKGSPRNLETRLTPVELRVENHSGRKLSIRYTQFELVGATKFHYAALSPLLMQEANDQLTTCVTRYMPGPYGGLGGAWNRRYWGYRQRPWWPNPYFFDPYSGPSTYTQCEEPLPTKDMMERALPEGTLEEGGTVSGFLYFQGVGDRERQVILQAQLVDAATNQPFGELSIPFQVRRD